LLKGSCAKYVEKLLKEQNKIPVFQQDSLGQEISLGDILIAEYPDGIMTIVGKVSYDASNSVVNIVYCYFINGEIASNITIGTLRNFLKYIQNVKIYNK
jgi:hypothetical protein